MHGEYDKTFYPFYATLSQKEQQIYSEIFFGIRRAEKRIILTKPASVEEICHVLDAIYYDRPELFWYSGSGSIKNGPHTLITVSPKYNCYQSNLSKNKSRFNDTINMILRSAKGKLPHEQERIIHDRLLLSVLYGHHPGDQSAYAALVERKAVCSGLSRAFQLLMQRLDIPCYYCSGEALSSENNEWSPHAWNIIKFGNDYYNLDITWDGSFDTNSDHMLNYKYYNCTDDTIMINHKRSERSFFLPKCNGTKLSFNRIYGYCAELQIIYDAGVTNSTPVKTEQDFFHILCTELERRRSDNFTISFPVYGKRIRDNALKWTGDVLKRFLPNCRYSVEDCTIGNKTEWYRVEIAIKVC